MTTRKESKRILSVKVSHEVDTDPDTSWLGEYASEPSSDYSIDRAHSEDCQSIIKAGIEPLERVIEYLVHQSQYASKDDDHDLYAIYDESASLLIEKQDELAECDCDGGDMLRNEYRYFNPNHGNYEGDTVENIRKYCRQDYERMEAMIRQEWGFIGIRAEAEVQLTGDLCQTISSGGLWGVESDSGEDYFKEVEAEELAQLKAQLHAIGFSKRATTAAFRNIQHAG